MRTVFILLKTCYYSSRAGQICIQIRIKNQPKCINERVEYSDPPSKVASHLGYQTLTLKNCKNFGCLPLSFSLSLPLSTRKLRSAFRRITCVWFRQMNHLSEQTRVHHPSRQSCAYCSQGQGRGRGCVHDHVHALLRHRLDIVPSA
jgi:hypothetical protein